MPTNWIQQPKADITFPWECKLHQKEQHYSSQSWIRWYETQQNSTQLSLTPLQECNTTPKPPHRAHLTSQKLQGNLGKIECCTSSSRQQRGQMREGGPCTCLSLIHHNKAIEKCLQRLHRNALSWIYKRKADQNLSYTMFPNGKHLDF